MVRYYYTKLKLFLVTWRAARLAKKSLMVNAKLQKLQTMIAAGFTNEKEYAEFNRKLIENRKRQLDPTQEKQLNNFRQKYYGDWKPKKRFKDSKDKGAINEAKRRDQEHTEFVRVLKNRNPRPNPEDLVNPSSVREQPIGDKPEGHKNG